MAEMQPMTKILVRLSENSKKSKEKQFTRLYRYLLRPDIYFMAYKKLYANNGASTHGIDNDTADGFSEKKIAKIIRSLKTETYVPTPVRRVYIKKTDGKMRPLGIPTFTDKLVQEALRMILESIYEPTFLDCSHGFRPNRSCQTVLKQIQCDFTGGRWFIEGDIKGCFDNINHATLVRIISEKIKDARLKKLIWKFLKAGYIDNWQYNNTYSGTPQGGIISPLLANIYLHELDKFVMKLKAEFDKPAEKVRTYEYAKQYKILAKIRSRIKETRGKERKALLKERDEAKKTLLKIPCKSQTDKKIVYKRYADDFLISVNGTKAECEEIKLKLAEFISETLKMTLSKDKTLITHSNSYARFLGYDVRVRRNGKIFVTIRDGKKYTTRTLSGAVELNIPIKDKINKFLFSNKIVEQKKSGEIKPISRKKILNSTELEIVETYNAELRGICNYYNLASNFYALNYFSYLMEYSCLKTLAAKHKCSVGKIKAKYKDGKGKWSIPYETKKGWRRLYFADYKKCRATKKIDDILPKAWLIYNNSVTTFESRLKAKKCELCKTEAAEHYEIHHVNKLKNLKGKSNWERVMIAKKRKTIVLCRNCHHRIHNQ